MHDAITMSRQIAAQDRVYEMIGELRPTGTASMPLRRTRYGKRAPNASKPADFGSGAPGS